MSEPADTIIHTENAEKIVHTEYSTPYRRVLSASTLTKDSVRNRKDEDIGSIREIMIDVPSGRVAYVVLSVGGFLGMGDRLFAIPWESLVLDEDRQYFILDVDKNRFENAPGFDEENWPDMAETSWNQVVREYWTGGSDYGVEAGRRYDRATAATSEPETEQKAREAREAIDGPEGDSLRRAEQSGKERGKGDAP